MSTAGLLIGACDQGPAAKSGAGANSASPPAAPEPKKARPELPDKAWAAKYREISGRVLGDGADGSAAKPLDDREFESVRGTLRDLISAAKDPHLRANAGVLLGSIYESRGARATAISYYKQAAAAVPEAAEPKVVMSLALAAEQRFADAVKVQEEVVRLVPDDLQAWLLLGELNMKASLPDQAKLAYAAYESRRKGLLDGLTLKKDGKYLKDAKERAQCAFLLGAARDEGTALGLSYALKSDPSLEVLKALVEVMGEQRLAGYKKMLEDKKSEMKDDELLKRIDWALAEIARDPVELHPGQAPDKADLQGASPDNPLGTPKTPAATK